LKNLILSLFDTNLNCSSSLPLVYHPSRVPTAVCFVRVTNRARTCAEQWFISTAGPRHSSRGQNRHSSVVYINTLIVREAPCSAEIAEACPSHVRMTLIDEAWRRPSHCSRRERTGRHKQDGGSEGVCLLPGCSGASLELPPSVVGR